MNTQLLKIQDIFLPENYLPNPNGLLAEKLNNEFAYSIGLLNLISEKKFYAGSSIGKFAYPHASLEGLITCCQLVEWLFYIDDQFDENEELVSDRNKVIELIEKYIGLLHAGTAGLTNDPVVKLSASLREKLLKLGSPEWFEQICISIEQYLRIGVLGSVDVWRSEQPYTLQKYMLNREYDSGVYICIDMVEIAAGINLPREVRNDLLVQKLRKLTTRHVAFANDLFSYDKEIPQHCNPNNLVHLLMHWKMLSFEEAVSETVKILNADMESFIEIKAKVLSTNLSVPLEKYIAGMEHWMSGNINWSLQTSRYKVNREDTSKCAIA